MIVVEARGLLQSGAQVIHLRRQILLRVTCVCAAHILLQLDPSRSLGLCRRDLFALLFFLNLFIFKHFTSFKMLIDFVLRIVGVVDLKIDPHGFGGLVLELPVLVVISTVLLGSWHTYRLAVLVVFEVYNIIVHLFLRLDKTGTS